MSEQRGVSTNAKRSYARKMLRAEIEDVKSKVRAAYTLKLKQEEGHELTPEEREVVEEAPFNQKLTERLEAMLARQSKNAEKINTIHEEDIWTLIRFFYLVRLAQQGFFYLIAGVYPYLEPQAITFLCDKMVGSTLYASRASLDIERKNHRNLVREIVRKLHLELDEPVADGFKTTYKQIMQAIHSLADQSVVQHPPAQQEDDDEEEKVPKTNLQPAKAQAIPPIWVVMPYSSMMDGASYALPGTIPTLPYPSTMLPMGLPMAYPNMQVDQKKKGERKEQKKKNHRHNKKDKQKQRQPNDDEEGSKQDEEEDRHKEEFKQEEHANQYDEDDKFADAETTDEDEENVTQAVQEEPTLVNDAIPGSVDSPSPVVSAMAQTDSTTKSQEVGTKPTESKEELQYEDLGEVNVAHSSWLSFAASSNVEVETNSPTSPRSNGSPSVKSKKYSNNKY